MEHGCRSLALIADIGINKERFGADGACEIVVGILEKYLENESVCYQAVLAIGGDHIIFLVLCF